MQKELNINNALNVNFGFQKIKDVIIWLADVNFNFAINVVVYIINANVKKKKIITLFNWFIIPRLKDSQYIIYNILVFLIFYLKVIKLSDLMAYQIKMKLNKEK